MNLVTPLQDTNKKRKINTSSSDKSWKREKNGDANATESATAVTAITMKSNAIISMLFSNRMKY